MRSSLKKILIATAVLFSVNVSNALEYVPGEVIVKMKSSTSGASVQSFMQKASSESGMRLKSAFKKMQVYHYKLNDQDTVENAIDEFSCYIEDLTL